MIPPRKAYFGALTAAIANIQPAAVAPPSATPEHCTCAEPNVHCYASDLSHRFCATCELDMPPLCEARTPDGEFRCTRDAGDPKHRHTFERVRASSPPETAPTPLVIKDWPCAKCRKAGAACSPECEARYDAEWDALEKSRASAPSLGTAPETTAPTATMCVCGHSRGEHYSIAPMRCDGGSMNVNCKCVGFLARAVSPVASSATPTPEPSDRVECAMAGQMSDVDAIVLLCGEIHRLRNAMEMQAVTIDSIHTISEDNTRVRSALASSQQEVAHLTAAIEAAAQRLRDGTSGVPADSEAASHLHGVAEDAHSILSRALTTEPR